MSDRLAITLPRPETLTGASRDYTEADIRWVTQNFAVEGPVQIAPFPGRGNINLHTYEVMAGGRPYLLQKVNSDVFKMPYRVMGSMEASITAQRAVQSGPDAVEGWEPVELVPTRFGKPYLDLTDEHGWSVWRMMVRIPDSVCYRSLGEVHGREAQLNLAQEVGRGLAIYHDLTAGIDPSGIEGSLPGYRDTGLYYRQFHSVTAGNASLADAAPYLPDDPILRASTDSLFSIACSPAEHIARLNDPDLGGYIDLVRDSETFAMTLWNALAQERIRHTLIHGDTKIENFLFDARSGRVKSLVDLDTIMAFTWLADWGDMLRSMVNVAGETERDMDRVLVDLDVYEAVAQGFLGTARQVTETEVQLMVTAVQIIALELGVRFLTDYLRGDNYFQLREDDPRDLNKVRAMVQLTLFQRLVEAGGELERRSTAVLDA